MTTPYDYDPNDPVNSYEEAFQDEQELIRLRQENARMRGQLQRMALRRPQRTTDRRNLEMRNEHSGWHCLRVQVETPDSLSQIVGYLQGSLRVYDRVSDIYYRDGYGKSQCVVYCTNGRGLARIRDLLQEQFLPVIKTTTYTTDGVTS